MIAQLQPCKFCYQNKCLGVICSYCDFLICEYRDPHILTYPFDSRHKDYNQYPLTLEQLKEYGFKRVSCRYRTASRVDVTIPEMVQMGCRKQPSEGIERMMDTFRRVYSHDCLRGIPESIFNKLPTAR